MENKKVMSGTISHVLIEAKESEIANSLKQKNIELYENMPMPKEREEAWRYTNVEKLDLGRFEQHFDNIKNKKNNIIKITKLPKNLEEKGVIFTDINTAFEKHYDILQYHFFKNIKENEDKFIAMNSAFWQQGIFLYVPKNIEVDFPIQVFFEKNNGNDSNVPNIMHNIIIVGQNSTINFIAEHSIENYKIENKNEKINNEILNNEITEVFAEDNAIVNFHYLNNLNKNEYNFTELIGTASRNATINWISACFGGKINRLRIDTLFNGEGSQSENLGLFLGREKEHIDITTNVYHNTENTTNNIMFDGILTDSSTSVYRGLIKIEKQAQKTNSYLSNHILKIGEKTLANSIPALQIEANDVKASHGATIGQINSEHLFYLMARGLTKEEAEKMIVEGFLEPIIEKIKLEYLKDKVRKLISA